MLQITEDTPPDMLAGAMDLTVHLPTGRAVKMAVERSTPMMDLLVQITTTHYLHLSSYTLQALGMAPSSEHSDKILPYKPNTPIGTLDTQHIKVVPKVRTLPVPKNVPPGHQPFESTFRLKVYLPRNQLYVTRVSSKVLLEDIMKKVCEEKNLDPTKYEFKHPGNLDEVLDSKLTLSDYQITEIYVVAKGCASLTQAFSSNDIMALRKEEERKQMHHKTGGGVFNLIFKKGKSSMGSGSISSDTRSISPTHSDDSRSVTPPAIQQKIIISPKKEPPPPERPKPPQRKRKPAPRPPGQSTEDSRRNSEAASRISNETPRSSEESRVQHEENGTTSEEKLLGTVPEMSELRNRHGENGLTISHSRNSSDSSGYHEASVLSENGNTSLPRRPKSAFVNPRDLEKGSKMLSQSTTNLSKMACHSKSTTSLGLAGRKKKSAPPPPPAVRASNPAINVVEIPSPVVVASQPSVYQQDEHGKTNDILVEAPANPIPKLRTRLNDHKSVTPEIPKRTHPTKPVRTHTLDVINKEELIEVSGKVETPKEEPQIENNSSVQPPLVSQANILLENSADMEKEDILQKMEALPIPVESQLLTSLAKNKPPEVMGTIPKTETQRKTSEEESSSNDVPKPNMLSHSKLYGFHLDDSDMTRQNSITSVKSLQSLAEFTGGMRKWNNLEELDDLSLASFMGPSSNSWVIGDQSEAESFSSQQALDSLVSISSSPSINIAEVKKEDKFFGSTDSGIAQEIVEKLSESEEVPPGTPPPPPILEDLPESADLPESVRKFEENTRTVHKELEAEKVDAASSKVDIEPEERLITPIIVPKEFIDTKHIEETEDIDWQYQIPSPPKAFKDSSPNYFNETPKSDCKDSVVTSPELFEKLKIIEDSQFDRETVISDVSSVVSEEEKPLCNNLSLENLEKRKSLVYNRELTTSLKMDSDLMHKSHEPYDSFSSSLSKFESTLIEIQNSSHNKNAQSLKYTQKTVTQSTNTLPNFKISTYDTPKQKIKVFEDDTVRSNTENFTKKGTYDQVSTKTAPLLTRSFLGRSMENIAFKPPRDISSNYNKEEYRYLGTESSISKNFGPTQSVFRSESFSSETSPSRPVSRSKSQLSLNANKHKERQIQNSNTNISRSNSFYDGLQSLGVMRRIQNKLSTPTSSMENINEYNKYQNSSYAIPETKPDAIASQKRIGSQKPTSPRSPVAKETTPVQEITFSRAVSIETTIPDSVPPTSGSSATSFTESLPPVQKEEQPKPSEKVYKYRGPPTISMTTWSERPKVPVNIKEDADYKLSNHNVNSKLIVNTTNNDVTSNNTIEIKNNFNAQVNDSNGVSIKVNGSEGINGNKYQQGGNVVIKINGDTRPKTIDNQRFISHTTAAGYRKPFSTINSNQRPHSIAFDSDFDISRVPVVRSFELKKPYKDMGNTSVTQIYHKDDQIPYGTLRRSEPLAEPGSRFSNGHTRYNESTQSSELAQRFATINNRNSYNSTNGESKEPKPVFRVNSFKPVGAAPVVRGFKQTNDFNKNRVTWHPMGNSNTLPVKPKETETSQVNSRATFSQSNLRRTDSNRTMDNGFANQDKNQPPKGVVNSFNSLPSVPKIESKAPPPPLMPKQFPSRKPVEPVVDQRDQLMSAIRNFGGKKGLKAAKI